MSENILLQNVNNINFTKKPMPVPYNYRISYKIAQVILIVGLSSIRGTCSLNKIHLLSRALSSSKESDRLIRFLEEKDVYGFIHLGFDPSLSRAISFAIAENTVMQANTAKYQLTEKGLQIFNEIMLNEDIMYDEKQFLTMNGKKISDKMLREILSEWRIWTC